MAKKYEVLGTVTKEFDLRNHGRSDGNGRGYLINAVRSIIGNKHFQERLKLRELYGYFGHVRRQVADKMELAEVEIVYIDGKPVVIENVPSNVLVDISVSDEGIVTHTEDFLNTPGGIAAKAMDDAGVGGFSWAVDGYRTPSGAVATALWGFDYVKHPSYIDKRKMEMMLESISATSEHDGIMHMLESVGFKGCAEKVMDYWERASVMDADDIADLGSKVLMFESVVQELQGTLDNVSRQNLFREHAMMEAIEKASVFMSESQKQALIRMDSDEDKAIAAKFFESLAGGFNSLPLGNSDGVTVEKPRSNIDLNDSGAIFIGEQFSSRNWK
ncbi:MULTISPECIES: hypothetical protein [Shewanella]|uniref:hypothetical protein n=1 Tax=Shewanella TaxID=22 RepID=UPI001AAFDA50|nr:hypothetical protein [Shewanella algae]MBO2580225.1 hypothetical protein [Shewanella algae]HDS1207812.1 hypothetical protein [Shewanella algae]